MIVSVLVRHKSIGLQILYVVGYLRSLSHLLSLHIHPIFMFVFCIADCSVNENLNFLCWNIYTRLRGLLLLIRASKYVCIEKIDGRFTFHKKR